MKSDRFSRWAWRALSRTPLVLVMSMLILGARDAPDHGRATLSISLTVFATVTYDWASNLFIYDYSVTNSYSSSSAVEWFGFEAVGGDPVVVAPIGWNAIRGFQGRPGSLVWIAVGTDYWVPTDLSVLDSPANTALGPGQAISGFQLRSTTHPSETAYHAIAFQPPLSIDSDEDDPYGPFDASPPGLWDSAALGLIAVPSTPTVVVGADSTSRSTDGLLRPSRNPSRAPVKIGFSLGRGARISIEVIDVGGRRVRQLESGRFAPGTHRSIWDGRDSRGSRVASGVYFVRFKIGNELAGSHSVVLLN